MTVDTSAIIAILKQEPGWQDLRDTLHAAHTLAISAGSYLELSIVVDSWKNPRLSAHIDELIEEFGIVIEPVTVEQARIAREAYRNYGRGSGHAAKLNYGDCFSYALARVMREPMLYTGDDFKQTDIRSA